MTIAAVLVLHFYYLSLLPVTVYSVIILSPYGDNIITLQ